MKKLRLRSVLAAAMAVAMVFSLSVGALADDVPSDVPSQPPEMGEGGFGGMGGDMGGGFGGGASGVESYDALTEYSSDTTVSGETFSSTGTDENAILVTGGSVALSNVTVTRVSSDSTGGDNSSFYGVGAAVLATGGSAYISDSTITTSAAGGAGAFAYGDGTVYIADTAISTEQDTSGGIHVAGGGTLYAWNLDVTTEGESSAAIRSDRGSGTMVVDGGSYVSNGTGSPAVYSTADITVNGATLTANSSEAICIEGLNTIRLYDCDLTGSMLDSSQNDCTWTVIVYQSMSGDSEVGCGVFQMSGGTLTSTNGGLFCTTNTESEFTLENVDITAAEDCEFFLRCTGNANQRGWGTTGSNGADCLFTAIDQTMAGDVVWDSISELDFYMTGESTLTGAFVQDESCAGDGGSGYANLYISSDSTWVVTGDSTLSALYCAGSIVDADGSTVTIQGSDGTVYVSGTSEYTVTVESCSAEADLSGAGSISEWSDYAVEQSAAFAHAGKSGPFDDVSYSDYCGEAVEWAVEQGVTVGTSDTTFSPNDTCTRAEIITFLYRAAGSPDIGDTENPFSDVSEDDYYYSAVLWAYANGLDDSSETFSPADPCTRAMVVEFLWRFAGSPTTETTSAFTDVSDGDSCAEAVAWALAQGVTTGTTETTFSPDDTCTRGQIVTFLYRDMA
ncbi:MAG: S-layer homology domain-containing protein [Oscillospiraceae bacterium]|nr:S-layer homology domain-containing protein [Oscillospiraceae bacterium]